MCSIIGSDGYYSNFIHMGGEIPLCKRWRYVLMLICKDLTKSFDKELFSNFNLELKPGEIVAITGPSGCGKTTLLRCICGLEDLDSGDLLLEGRDISTLNAEERGIGLIFQKAVLYPHLNVEGNLRLGNKKGDITNALVEVGMEGFEERRVESLSGGEGQRVSLARALLAKPKVLLLDEPFSSLDEELSRRLVSDVRSILKERKCPAILVTHNKNIAENFADYVISL
ncbi:MAG: ATP-binding cassette domain-containing protein [Candidatus Poseidoniales archaeon]|nr:MAG: ATP-binding cassette domain-containing protein [Candidatus Poseidoniales archaeon]